MPNPDPRRYRITNGMLVQFFVLAFAITWVVVIPALSFVPDDRLTPFFILAAFGPFLSAVVTIRSRLGRAGLGRWLRGIFRLRIPVTLWLAGMFLLPVVMGALHYGLYRSLGGQPDFSDAIPWFLYLANLVPTALLTGGNEEPGWRGFALPALLERFHPVTASVVLGLAHAAWHLPLMRYYGTTFPWYVYNLLPLTFILNWLFLVSRGSVIPVMLLHAGTNVIGGFIPTPGDVLDGFGSWVFLRGTVYWGMAIVILVVTRGRLGYRPSTAAAAS